MAGLVIGVGASAGGLEALQALMRGVPDLLNAAWVVIQHLSPDYKSHMADLLSRHTRMPVVEATDGMLLRAGVVVVAPAASNLEILGNALVFRNRPIAQAPNLPINQFFASLAASAGPRAVAIVLSGTGSDGRIGLEAVKQAGGLALAQTPDTARFDGMPLAAIASGLVDDVLPPGAMGARLLAHAEGESSPVDPVAPVDDAALGRITEAVLKITGMDFSDYKDSTVTRRIARRMVAVGAPNESEYAARIEADPDEARTLADELLIHVTEFFRDPEVFHHLAAHVLPNLISRAGARPIRVWVVGCSTGQEAYTFAMLLAEANPPGGYTVFATDLDTAALARASAGVYPDAAAARVPERYASKYLHRRNHQCVIDRSLRSRVVFANHNITRDHPFTKIDLISCRNVLIYMNPSLQRRVLATLTHALVPDGVLVLGTSESPGELADHYRTVDPHLKLLQRRPGARIPYPMLPHAQRATPAVREPSNDALLHAALNLFLDALAPAAVLTTANLDIVRVFGNAGTLLRTPVGPPSSILTPMLPVNLQSATSLAAHRAITTGAAVSMLVEAGDALVHRVRATPLDLPGHERHLAILFERAAPPSEPSATTVAELTVDEEIRRQFDEMRRELAYVRESHQSAVEQFETTNEELQATNEELMASNEELQSTNEELQSVNEELSSVNAEYQARIGELIEANTVLDNVFNASPVGLLFVDAHMKVRRFTPNMKPWFALLDRITCR